MILEKTPLQYPIKISSPFKFNIYHSIINFKNIQMLYDTISLEDAPLTIRTEGSDKTYKVYNKILHDHADGVDFTTQELSCPWQTLLNELTNMPYLQIISEWLEQDITNSYIQILLKKYSDGGFISMHTDDADVYATHLFFLNPYFDPATGGNLIFHRVDGSILASIPSVSNISVLFERTDNSWHSVEPCNSSSTPKITLQVAFWKKLKKRNLSGRIYT